jgi:hypothetical protein
VPNPNSVARSNVLSSSSLVRDKVPRHRMMLKQMADVLMVNW